MVYYQSILGHYNDIRICTFTQPLRLQSSGWSPRVDQLVNTIDDLNMDSLALTEHGNMFSVVPFYKQAKNAGIKPIIGCEAYVAVESRHNKKPAAGGGWGNNHLILLVKSNWLSKFNEACYGRVFRGVLL